MSNTSKIKEVLSEWDITNFQFDEDSFAWLNEELLESILRKNFNQPNLKIIKVEKSQAVIKGENYGSCPAKVLIDYKSDECEKKLHLMVKSCHSNRSETINVFAQENFFYEMIWPKIAKALNLYDDENPSYFVPKYFTGGPSTAVIMSDVGQKGYRNVPRYLKLDFEHCKLILQSLALLHATSIKIGQDEPEFKKSLKNDYDYESVNLCSMYKNGILILAKEVLSWSGYEHYGPRLEKLTKTMWRKLKEIASSNSGRITVINHGDCWSNNILFHYPEGSEKPDSIIMVDFQDIQWGSPVIDLLYFFYFSSQIDVLFNNFDCLIDYYLSEIRKTLNKINLPLSVFPEDDFRADLEEGFLFGVVNALTFQVVTQTPPGESMDFTQVLNEEALEENSQWRKTLSSQNLREYIQKVLDQANAKRLL